MLQSAVVQSDREKTLKRYFGPTYCLTESFVNSLTVQVYVKKPVICAQSLENFLKSTFVFLCFRERGAGPGASRAYGRDGRTDGPKIAKPKVVKKLPNVLFYLFSVWQF